MALMRSPVRSRSGPPSFRSRVAQTKRELRLGKPCEGCRAVAEATTHFYSGLTSEPRRRLDDHNDSRCPHTARYRPWQLHVVIEFADEQRAIRFERYLKSGSGRAFAKRHFEK